MAKQKVPFKFVKTKPEPEELNNKLGETYTSNIDEYSPKDIRVLLFFHLSMNGWEEAKADLNLTTSGIKKVLSQTKSLLNYDSETYKMMTNYKELLDLPKGIPSELIITVLTAKLSEEAVINCLGEDCSDMLHAKAYFGDPNTVPQLIHFRDGNVKSFAKYLSLSKDLPMIAVNSKNEMYAMLLDNILHGQKEIGYFVYTPEEVDSEAF